MPRKKGMTEVARNGRQVSRALDALAGAQGADIGRASLDSRASARGRWPVLPDVNTGIPTPHQPSPRQGRQPDPGSGGSAAHAACPAREVVLVSRTSTCASRRGPWGRQRRTGNDKALEDGDLLYSGALQLPPDFWKPQRQIGGKLAERRAHVLSHQRPHRAAADDQPIRLFRGARRAQPVCTRERNPRQDGRAQRHSRTHGHAKNAVWGVTTRNREQNFAINLLMDGGRFRHPGGHGRQWARP